MSVYAVASGKGGVGKTTTAAALGACAAATGRKTVVVDADLGMADLAAILDVDDGPTLHDVLAGRASVAEACRPAEGGFDVLTGDRDLEAYPEGDPAGLGDVIDALREQYEVIILDTAAGLSQDVLVPLGLADEVVLVSTTDTAALRDTEKTRQLVEKVDGSVAGLVLTRVVDAGGAADADLPIRRLGMVPEDDAVSEAEQAGVAVPIHNPGGPAGSAYIEVAAALLGVAVGEVDLGEDRSGGGEGGMPTAGAAPVSENNESNDPEVVPSPGTSRDEEDSDESDENGSRSLLSRLTGGLLG